MNSHTHSWSNSHSHTLNNRNSIWLNESTSSGKTLYVAASTNDIGFYLNHGGNQYIGSTTGTAGVPDSSTPSVASQSISGTTGGASGSTANNAAFTSGQASGSTANSTAFNSGAASGNTANSTAFASGGPSTTNTANSTAFDTGASNGNTGNSTEFNTGSYGSSTVTAITIEPKYISMYAWKRIA